MKTPFAIYVDTELLPEKIQKNHLKKKKWKKGKKRKEEMHQLREEEFELYSNHELCHNYKNKFTDLDDSNDDTNNRRI